MKPTLRGAFGRWKRNAAAAEGWCGGFWGRTTGVFLRGEEGYAVLLDRKVCVLGIFSVSSCVVRTCALCYVRSLCSDVELK
jgi:hypothetical protein